MQVKSFSPVKFKGHDDFDAPKPFVAEAPAFDAPKLKGQPEEDTFKPQTDKDKALFNKLDKIEKKQDITLMLLIQNMQAKAAKAAAKKAEKDELAAEEKAIQDRKPPEGMYV